MTQKEQNSNDRSDPPEGDIRLGILVIKERLKSLSKAPGVYRMVDENENVLYIGKAKNLKNRVTSYTRPSGLTYRIAKMVALTRSMVFITTHTEAEALLLEANLIKTLKPRFNVLLRDDKSFPYILLKDHKDWPQITKHRGAQKIKGTYFGPFASAQAVNRTLNTLQRIFLLRSCSDSVLKNRTRACLLYQIKRCSAPCVDKISSESYQMLLKETKDFLSGKDRGIQKKLASLMQEASDNQEFEKAGAYRDRLRALTNVQQQKSVITQNIGNTDVFSLYTEGGQSCIQVFFFRTGQNWGNRAYFPRHQKGEEGDKIMGAFIAQFYDNKTPPKNIMTNIKPESRRLLEEAFTTKCRTGVKISIPKRGDKKKLINEGEENAKAALMRRMAENSSQQKWLDGVASLFDLEGRPERIEVYDNSHISGTNALGGMIVAGPEGFIKNAYRKFNIKSKTLSPGDDYGMMKEVLKRRFSRLIKETEEKGERENWPDLLLIDGGKGQLSVVNEIMEELGLSEIPVVAISKGPDRNAGREQFHIKGKQPFTLPPDNPVLYFLQRLRDEAHRFAIGSHRARRKMNLNKSMLDQVPGIGPKRKKSLLHHFGSAKAVEAAGLIDLEAVDNVSKAMAKNIYNFFHERG